MAQPTPPLSLKAAVKQIKQSYEFAVGKGRPSPFFFVTGAGISVPQVPLAQEIIRDCKTRSGATESPSSESTILDEYSRCLEEAFPAPIERQDYFQNLISGKPIPAANFRLAHLLLGEQGKPSLASLVITTNFDDFLAQALRLFGKEHVLCDSPSTTPRLDLSNKERLQIVHVHGTYYFYDIKNLSGEVELAAAASEETTATMGSLLDAVLRDQSPIVVGYGGWDGDVFMKSLRRRLRGGTLPQPLYWCCYRRNDWQSLPEWLQTHSSVRFVEPEEPLKPNGMSVPAKEQTPTSGAIVGAAADLFGHNRENENLLDSQFVFDALIQAFDLRPPELTQNPIQFFADQLNRSLPRDGATQGRDLYRIKSTVEELRAASKWILEYRQQRTVKEQQLHAVREQLRGAKYVDAMPLVMGIDVEKLNDRETEDLWEMAWEIINSGEFSERPSDETLAMLDRFQQIADLMPDRDEIPRRVVKGLLIRVIHLVLLKRVDESVVTLGDLVRRSQQTDDPEIHLSVGELLYQTGTSCLTSTPEKSVSIFQLLLATTRESQDERVLDLLAKGRLGLGIALLSEGRKAEGVDALGTALARINVGTSTLPPAIIAQVTVTQGIMLDELGRSAEAVVAYDEVLRRFGESTEPGIQEQVAKALVNKGLTLEKLTPPVDPVATYDEVVQRFGEATEPDIQEQVARALVNKGVALVKLASPMDPLATYDEVVQRFGEATKPGIQAMVALALVNKAVTLGDRGKPDDKLTIYDEVVRRFGEATEPGIQEQVAKALVNKGLILGKLTPPVDPVATYDEVVERFGEATESGTQTMVALALIYKAVTLGDRGHLDDELTLYEEVVRRFGERTEPDLREQVARALVSKGVTLRKLTPPVDPLATYDEVVQRFGEATESGTRMMVALALINKAVAFGDRGQRDEESNTYAEVVRRFGEATEPDLREQVGNALNGIAFNLLLEAKATWNREGRERAREGLRQAAEQAERALQYVPSNPIMLGNKGYALFLAGETEAGTAALHEAIKLGGEEIRKGELGDAEIDPVPLDEEFKELLRSIPVAG